MPITFNRNTIPVLAIVAAAGLTMSACRDETPADTTNTTATAPGSAVDQAKSAAQDAAGKVGDAAAQAKTAFVDGASRQLENLEIEIEDFISKARERMPDASSEVNRLRDELNSAIARARVELEKVRNAGADVWKDSSATFQQAFAEVQRTFTQVKEQLAPGATGAPAMPDNPVPQQR